jgi:hypothetical protein
MPARKGMHQCYTAANPHFIKIGILAIFLRLSMTAIALALRLAMEVR